VKTIEKEFILKIYSCMKKNNFRMSYQVTFIPVYQGLSTSPMKLQICMQALTIKALGK